MTSSGHVSEDSQHDGPVLPPLCEAPIIVVTRFSFVGQSGWQGDASRDSDLLFQTDRLTRRLALFSAITLPSLAGQTDRSFRHVILTSENLPDWAMAALQAACDTAYGDADRYVILARPPAPARRPLRTYMQASFSRDPVVQVVVDDDDGLANDFIANLRSDLTRVEVENPDLHGNLPFFISYPVGLGLVVDGAEGRALYRHRYPFINLGLSLIGTRGGKNLFAIDHLAAPRKFGSRVMRRPPMFLRSVHGFNDSRVKPTGRWEPMPDWEQDADLCARFPYLMRAMEV